MKKGNGIIKEYNNRGLFELEGFYLDGKLNEFGKEYNSDGKIIFEGEYLNGQRWNGKEKYYNSKGNVILLECENIKGEKNRNPIWKEYYKDGTIKFLGEYLNGKRNGYGNEYYEN